MQDYKKFTKNTELLALEMFYQFETFYSTKCGVFAGDRGSMGSTLSLACVNIDNKDTVRELRQEWSRERVRFIH